MNRLLSEVPENVIHLGPSEYAKRNILSAPKTTSIVGCALLELFEMFVKVPLKMCLFRTLLIPSNISFCMAGGYSTRGSIMDGGIDFVEAGFGSECGGRPYDSGTSPVEAWRNSLHQDKQVSFPVIPILVGAFAFGALLFLPGIVDSVINGTPGHRESIVNHGVGAVYMVDPRFGSPR